MKFILFLILFILVASCSQKERNTDVKNLFQQDFINNRFLSNTILGYETDKSIIKLWEDKRKTITKSVGVSTSFEKNKFASGNFSFCGNDYFTDVNGHFVLYEKNKIMISVDSIKYSGENKKLSEYRNKQEINYIISKKNDTIILTKTEH